MIFLLMCDNEFPTKFMKNRFIKMFIDIELFYLNFFHVRATWIAKLFEAPYICSLT